MQRVRSKRENGIEEEEMSLNWNWNQKRKDSNERSDVRIISNKGLESITLAAITTAAMTTITGTTTGTATIDLRLRVNAQPVINLRKLLKLKLKHNQQSIESNDFNFNNPINGD
jgi:hypothetical protein